MSSCNLPFVPFRPLEIPTHSQVKLPSSSKILEGNSERAFWCRYLLAPHSKRPSHMTTQQKEGGGNEKECRAHTQPALTHNEVLPSGNTIDVLDRDWMPWE